MITTLKSIWSFEKYKRFSESASKVCTVSNHPPFSKCFMDFRSNVFFQCTHVSNYQSCSNIETYLGLWKTLNDLVGQSHYNFSSASNHFVTFLRILVSLFRSSHISKTWLPQWSLYVVLKRNHFLALISLSKKQLQIHVQQIKIYRNALTLPPNFAWEVNTNFARTRTWIGINIFKNV